MPPGYRYINAPALAVVTLYQCYDITISDTGLATERFTYY